MISWTILSPQTRLDVTCSLWIETPVYRTSMSAKWTVFLQKSAAFSGFCLWTVYLRATQLTGIITEKYFWNCIAWYSITDVGCRITWKIQLNYENARSHTVAIIGGSPYNLRLRLIWFLLITFLSIWSPCMDHNIWTVVGRQRVKWRC